MVLRRLVQRRLISNVVRAPHSPLVAVPDCVPHAVDVATASRAETVTCLSTLLTSTIPPTITVRRTASPTRTAKPGGATA